MNLFRHIIVSNTLYICCLILVCVLVNEWKVLGFGPNGYDTFFPPPILNDARTSLPNSDVYHIWAWLCCFHCHRYLLFLHGGTCAFFLEDLAALTGQSEILDVGWEAGEVWQGVCEWRELEDVNEACHIIAKPS